MSAERAWLMDAVGSRVAEFYSALGVDLQDKGGDEAAVRCFANASAHARDDRKPSCSVNLTSGLFHCQGCGAKGNAYQAALAKGFAESAARVLAQKHGLFLELAKPEKVRLPGERTILKWRKALKASPKIIARLEELKGWTYAGMVRCGLGWDGERVVFPIREPKNVGTGRTLKLSGVVRYVPNGDPKSRADAGSKRLLFPPPEMIAKRRPLFLVEGEPAAVSVWSLGFPAVAVPGAGSWRFEWRQRLLGRRLIVLPDCDTTGRDLADRICQALPKARIVDLEPSCEDGSDIGDWIVQARADGGVLQLRRLLGRL